MLFDRGTIGNDAFRARPAGQGTLLYTLSRLSSCPVRERGGAGGEETKDVQELKGGLSRGQLSILGTVGEWC